MFPVIDSGRVCAPHHRASIPPHPCTPSAPSTPFADPTLHRPTESSTPSAPPLQAPRFQPTHLITTATPSGYAPSTPSAPSTQPFEPQPPFSKADCFVLLVRRSCYLGGWSGRADAVEEWVGWMVCAWGAWGERVKERMRGWRGGLDGVEGAAEGHIRGNTTKQAPFSRWVARRLLSSRGHGREPQDS